MCAYSEYASNSRIMFELKHYRPARRPITQPEIPETQKQKKTRLLIVRDWFFYSVWATRIKTAISDIFRAEDAKIKKKQEIRRLYDKFTYLISIKTKGKSQELINSSFDKEPKNKIQYYLSTLQKALGEEGKKDDEDCLKPLYGIQFTTRLQEVNLAIYLKDTLVKSAPIVQIKALVI